MNGRDVWHYLSVARHSGFVAVSVLPANWRQSPLQHAALDAVCAGIFCPYSGRTGIIFPRLASMTKKKKLSRTGRTETSSRKNKMRDRHSERERERKAKQTRGKASWDEARRRGGALRMSSLWLRQRAAAASAPTRRDASTGCGWFMPIGGWRRRRRAPKTALVQILLYVNRRRPGQARESVRVCVCVLVCVCCCVCLLLLVFVAAAYSFPLVVFVCASTRAACNR